MPLGPDQVEMGMNVKVTDPRDTVFEGEFCHRHGESTFWNLKTENRGLRLVDVARDTVELILTEDSSYIEAATAQSRELALL